MLAATVWNCGLSQHPPLAVRRGFQRGLVEAESPTPTDALRVRVLLPADSSRRGSGGMKFACGCGADPKQ
ncbi:hypothetical protein [Haloquadratum walsbyi]|uniref:hypothetical protein n=1 Tax=Haloquadratum walsbyi TaxID=293091 RepID=UPI0011EA6D32|nr:hypothetical protein [Haloquadratum walsbyi]